jgi:hypothetical protein
MDYSQFESAYLEGLTQFERWRDAFEREFIAPLGDEMMSALMRSLTPEQHIMLQQSNPAAHEQVMKRITKAR